MVCDDVALNPHPFVLCEEELDSTRILATGIYVVQVEKRTGALGMSAAA